MATQPTFVARRNEDAEFTNVDIAGDLAVAGDATVTGTLTVTGNVTQSGALSVTGELSGGGVVKCLRATLAYTDTTAKALFTIPAGAYIVEWIVNVTTLFNSDGTDQVDIGISGTQEKFAADIDVSTTGLKTTGVVAAQVGALQATAQAVTAIYAAGGSAASTGAAVIMCKYFIPAA